MAGIVLIFTLAVIGGLIAYLGDKVGMKVGRKRLSLFGLRPKYTSIIITIVTGIVIAILSIAVLTIVSNDVRTALFQMREIQEALQISEDELQQRTAQVQQMEENLMLLTNERDQAAAELAEARIDLERATDEYAALLADLETARREVALERLRVEELEQRRDELEERYVYLLDGYESLVTQYDRLVDEYLRLETTMRTGDLALQADEIFHAQIFLPGADIEELTQQLSNFLAEADRRALLRGARLDSDENLAIMLTQQTFELAVFSLLQQEEPVVVRAVSKNNTVAGEAVVTYLELIPHEQVFGEREILAEVVVDSSLLQEVDRVIVDLIGQANQAAINAGLMTADGAAVVVSGEQFLQTIAAARERAGNIRIQAVTQGEVWTTDGPIALDLDIISL